MRCLGTGEDVGELLAEAVSVSARARPAAALTQAEAQRREQDQQAGRLDDLRMHSVFRQNCLVKLTKPKGNMRGAGRAKLGG